MPRPSALFARTWLARTWLALPLLAAALAACGKSDNAPGPGGVTVGEARALDEAAQMVEQRRLPAEAVRPPATAAPIAPTPSSAIGESNDEKEPG